MFSIDYGGFANLDIKEEIQTIDPTNGNENMVLPISFRVYDLDLFCAYVVDFEHEAVSHAALVNAQTMFKLITKTPYERDDLLKARINFILLALEARIDLNVTNKALVEQHIRRNCHPNFSDIIDDDIMQCIAEQELTEHICKYINTLVYENLINGYALIYADTLDKMLNKKSMGGYEGISDFTNDFKMLIHEIDSKIKKSEEYTREGKGFDLSKDNIKNTIHSVTKTLKAPTNKLQTGIQYLNTMLNGGFESGRSYLFMGITGVGKSIILLSTALWFTKYNVLPKTTHKKQAVLFISQENSMDETFERIFNINVSEKDVRSFSDEQIEEMMVNSGLIVDDDSKINFIFRYFNDKEIGVDDIDDMIEDCSKEGIQIIAVVQDYIEKLKPKHRFTEMRHSLGSIAIEMSELAKKRKIPFISAAQLNRSASTVVDNATGTNRTNTTKLLGKNNISESWD